MVPEVTGGRNHEMGPGRRGGDVRMGIIDLAGFLFKDGGSGKIAWGIKCLLHKHGNQTSNPRTHTQGRQA